MRRRRLLLVCAAVAVLLGLGPTLWLYASTTGSRRTVARAGHADVAIVFGAGIRPDGSLTPLLRDRVDLGVRLYATGHVTALLMTGDNSTTQHDEVGAMKAYAVAHGVPGAAVSTDHAGFSTYDSCYRARAIFGVRRAILVTTRFHLPRALYVCRRLGVRATGVGAADFGRYTSPAVGWQVRELFAGVKAVLQVEVLRPKPHFLGPREPYPGMGGSAP